MANSASLSRDLVGKIILTCGFTKSALFRHIVRHSDHWSGKRSTGLQVWRSASQQRQGWTAPWCNSLHRKIASAWLRSSPPRGLLFTCHLYVWLCTSSISLCIDTALAFFNAKTFWILRLENHADQTSHSCFSHFAHACAVFTTADVQIHEKGVIHAYLLLNCPISLLTNVFFHRTIHEASCPS